MLAYSDEVGDDMPDDSGDRIVPLRDRRDEWTEYKHGRDELECASYGHFCKVLRTAPEVAHIQHARKCMNFQKCTTCVELNTKVALAIATGNAQTIAAAKAERSRHHIKARKERLCYYKNIEDAVGQPGKFLSLILDKWDSAKCTSPCFPMRRMRTQRRSGTCAIPG